MRKCENSRAQDISFIDLQVPPAVTRLAVYRGPHILKKFTIRIHFEYSYSDQNFTPDRMALTRANIIDTIKSYDQKRDQKVRFLTKILKKVKN